MKNCPSSLVITALCWSGSATILISQFHTNNEIIRYILLLCGVVIGYAGYYLGQSSIFGVGFYFAKERQSALKQLYATSPKQRFKIIFNWLRAFQNK
jgi:hypothetical protein